jgi:hypothetical protein
MNDFLDNLLSDYKAEDYLEGYSPTPTFIPHDTYAEVTIIGAEYDEQKRLVKYNFTALKPVEYKDIKFSAKLPLDSSPDYKSEYVKEQSGWEKKVTAARKKFFAVDAALGGRIILAIQSRKPVTPMMVASHAGKKLIVKVGFYEEEGKNKCNYLIGTGVKGSVVESTATAPAARPAAPVAQAPRPAAVEVAQDDDGDGIPF